MNAKGKKRGWMFRWRKFSSHDIPRHVVALTKVSRSILEDDLTLESGDIFTHSSDEELDLIAPPCRMRQENEGRADFEEPTGSRTRDSIRQDETTTTDKRGIPNHTCRHSSTVLTLGDCTAAPLAPWVCW